MPPRLLPLVTTTGPHGSRSALTCKFRCGNACDHPEPNTSGNEHIQDVLRAAVARRTLLKGAMGAATATALGSVLPSPAAAAIRPQGADADPVDRFGAITFEPVPPNRRDNVVVPSGYDYDVVARWGDRVTAKAPHFDVYDQTPRRRQSSSATTATTSLFSPWEAPTITPCSWSTTSTPTNTSCTRRTACRARR